MSAFRAILIILGIIAVFLLLGLLLGLLFLLLQVVVLMLPVSCVSAALMFLTLFVYTKRRMKQLLKSSPDFSHMIGVSYKASRAKKWSWDISLTNVEPLLDPGMCRALMMLAGVGFSLVAINYLKTQGVFTHQTFWFWGKTTHVPEPVSFALGTCALGIVIALIFIKLKPEAAFNKLLASSAGSLISSDDEAMMEQVNELYSAVLQLFSQVSPAVKASGGLALIQELQAIEGGLTSTNMIDLLCAKQWKEFQQVMVGMMQDLERIHAQLNGAGSSYASYGESDEEKAFRILGVPSAASDEEIKSAYRTGALHSHPDRNGTGDNSQMQELNAAYAFLRQRRGF